MLELINRDHISYQSLWIACVELIIILIEILWAKLWKLWAHLVLEIIGFQVTLDIMKLGREIQLHLNQEALQCLEVLASHWWITKQLLLLKKPFDISRLKLIRWYSLFINFNNTVNLFYSKSYNYFIRSDASHAIEFS